ncbi:MAG: fatty acid desaturase [Parcubacteria group bacterium Gr01-1014_3]|nr:MAG: fatty acid desaturase [Parcubacteria group bacterium Gr01-1014_3]
MIFRVSCWLLLGSIPREFAAVHRKHHKYTDIEGDPHSPFVNGYWSVLLGNIFLYQSEAKKIDLNYWGKGVPTYDWLDKHSNLGLLSGFILVCVVFGVFGWLLSLGFFIGVLFGAGAHLLLGLDYLLATGLVNSHCHKRGYKTYKDADAYNNRFIAFLTCGEGLHNNHHKYQSSPRLRTGERWFELDEGWLLIKFLDRIGQIESKGPEWPS